MIVSLEDKRRYKSLRRHLTARGMTPDDYQAKWGLRASAPMTVPSYLKRCAEIARQIGLARIGHKAIAAKRKVV